MSPGSGKNHSAKKPKKDKTISIIIEEEVEKAFEDEDDDEMDDEEG